MPRCVAAGCSNSHKENVSIHQFPKDEILHKKWAQAVSRTRVNFKGSPYSVLCSEHFTLDDFEPRSILGEKIGLSGKTKMRLKKGVIPSVFKRPALKPLQQENKKRRSSSAYEKRERSRILHEIETQLEEDKNRELETFSSDELVLSATKEVQVQTDPVEPSHCKCCLHKQPKVTMKNVSVQFNLRLESKGNQIFPDTDREAKENYGGMQTTNRTMQTIDGEETNSCGSGEGECNAKDKETKNSNDSNTKSESETEDERTDDTGEESHDETEDEDYEDDDSDSYEEDNPNDPDYQPFDDIGQEVHDDDDIDYIPGDIYKGRKFIVYEEQLLGAFNLCPLCSELTDSKISAVLGTFCRVQQICNSCSFNRIWDSQPMVRNTPAGNLLLSACMLFSGSGVAKTLRLFKHFRCASISASTYFNHQKSFLLPSVETVWFNDQRQRIEELAEGKDVVIGGDGRCDSPGHSAKYGCYTLMDLNSGRILDVQLVQSNEVSSSNAMEKEGLIRAVNSLEKQGVKIDVLVTDRHTSIKKWMRESMAETTHKFDNWHIAKGIRKKLDAVAKLVCGKPVRPWVKSIINHVYWCATSTESGDGKVMLAKWMSLGRHIQNKHDGHGDLFPNCLHGEIPRTERKKWLTPGTTACNKVMKIIENPRLWADISMMSEKYQTSKLEAFHSLLNHFAPKTYHFTHRVQKCRTLLAALHYNENGGRRQAMTESGEDRWAINYPKYKKGAAVAKPILEAPTYDYVDKLLNLVILSFTNDVVHPQVVCPPPLSSKYEQADKAEVIAAHRTRFVK